MYCIDQRSPTLFFESPNLWLRIFSRRHFWLLKKKSYFLKFAITTIVIGSHVSDFKCSNKNSIGIFDYSGTNLRSKKKVFNLAKNHFLPKLSRASFVFSQIVHVRTYGLLDFFLFFMNDSYRPHILAEEAVGSNR